MHWMQFTRQRRPMPRLLDCAYDSRLLALAHDDDYALHRLA